MVRIKYGGFELCVGVEEMAQNGWTLVSFVGGLCSLDGGRVSDVSNGVRLLCDSRVHEFVSDSSDGDGYGCSDGSCVFKEGRDSSLSLDQESGGDGEGVRGPGGSDGCDCSRSGAGGDSSARGGGCEWIQSARCGSEVGAAGFTAAAEVEDVVETEVSSASVAGKTNCHGDGSELVRSVGAGGVLNDGVVSVVGPSVPTVERTKGQIKREKAKRRKLRKQGKGVPMLEAEADLSKLGGEKVVFGFCAESGGSGDVGRGALGVDGQGTGSGVDSFRDVTSFQRFHLESVTSDEERKVLARQWYDRKLVENELAIQRARYNVKRNSYLDRAKISEKKWEQERLSCEQKLARITEARFGSKPGYAETLASISDGSEIPPSLSTGSDSPANLSDGTVSPDSSMSVAEANRLIRKVEELSGRVVQLELEKKALTKVDALNLGFGSPSGRVEIEDGKIHRYDGSGQYIPPTPRCLTEDCAGSMDDYPEELQHYSGSVY